VAYSYICVVNDLGAHHKERESVFIDPAFASNCRGRLMSGGKWDNLIIYNCQIVNC
jgi:hypothetical protein